MQSERLSKVTTPAVVVNLKGFRQPFVLVRSHMPQSVITLAHTSAHTSPHGSPVSYGCGLLECFQFAFVEQQ